MENKEKAEHDFLDLLKPYEDMWIALSKDNPIVIGSAKTLEELFNKLGEEDYRKFEFMKVPAFNVCYAPHYL